VVHNVHAFHFGAAVDAGHENVGTDRLMLFNVLPNTLSFACAERLALYRRVLAHVVVFADLLVAEHFLAAQVLVVADELRVFQLFLDFLFDVDELWLVAQHGALACFFGKFIKADLMVPVSAHFALPGVYEDGLAQGAQQFWFHIVDAHYVARVHTKGHPFEVLQGVLTLTEGLGAQVLRSIAAVCHQISI
jgi:hypothetical protein